MEMKSHARVVVGILILVIFSLPMLMLPSYAIIRCPNGWSQVDAEESPEHDKDGDDVICKLVIATPHGVFFVYIDDL